MAEHFESVPTSQFSDAEEAANVLCKDVAVPGEKFHQLMASLKD
jgi:hypothetical protein